MSSGLGSHGPDAGGGASSFDLVGRTLHERYRVQSVLGKGGMGTVYLATDERLSRPVVVKVPHPSLLAEPGFAERFEREIKSLTALEHPHVVKVLDAGQIGGVPFAVLQYLPGQSLTQRVKQKGGRLDPADVLEWLPGVADALDYIHRQGMVHRDVKPGNVLFDAEGHVFLADFGIAKAIQAKDTGLTVTGQTPGSPDYMAPEAVKAGPVTPAYDQFSLAVVVYEALSGKLPFPGETPIDALVVKQTSVARPLQGLSASLPEASAKAVMRALEKDPAKRFASCRGFADAFVSGMRVRAGAQAVSDESITLGFGGKHTLARGRAAPATAPTDDPSATRLLDKDAATHRRKKGGTWKVVVVLLLLVVGGFAAIAVTNPGLFGGEGPRVTIASPADGSFTNANELVVTGKVGDPKAQVRVAGNRVEVGKDGTFTASLPMKEDREYHPLVVAEGDGGTTNVRLHVVRDTVLPVLTATRTPAATGGKPRVSGSAKDDHLAEVRVDGKPVALRSDGTFDVEVGPGAVEVVATDQAGNATKWSAGGEARIAITSPAEGAWVAGRDLVVGGTVQDLGSATLEVNGVKADVAEGKFQARVPAPADGPLEIVATAGAAASSKVVLHVVVDASPPMLDVLEPAGAIGFTSGKTAKIRGTATDANLAEVRVTDAAGERTVTVAEGGAFEAEVAVPDGGAATVTLVAKDKAGNASAAVKRTLRHGAAAMLSLSSPTEGALLSTREVHVSGTAKGGTETSVLVNGTEVALGAGGTFTVDVGAGDDGPFAIVVESAPGTPFAAKTTRNVDVDSSPPRFEFTDPAAAVETYATPTTTIRGRAVDPHLAEVRMDGKVVPTDAEGRFEVPVTLQEAAAVTVAFQATDRLGHQSMKVHRSLKYEPAGATEAKIVVTEPAGGSFVRAKADVWVRGRLTSPKGMGKVFVDGRTAKTADDGRFEIRLQFAAVGPVRVSIEGEDGAGRPAKATLDLVVEKEAGPVRPGIPPWARVTKEQVVVAEKLGVPVAFESASGLRFVLVPPGTFAMGSPPGEPGRRPDETPHSVTFTRALYVGVTEVTNEQWRRVVGPHDSGNVSGFDLNGSTMPVANVTYDDARTFVKVLRGNEGRPYRLPTEAEWEYFARAGTQGRWWWGDREDAAAKYANAADLSTKSAWTKDMFPSDDGRPFAAAVGTYGPNPWGLYDTVGNVLEWCMDWYGDYPAGSVTDPLGPGVGKGRVVRGGSWKHGPSTSRLGSRGIASVLKGLPDLGFRLVCGVGK
jgi:formylglycine-generating enzyme required for sulfatase activity